MKKNMLTEKDLKPIFLGLVNNKTVQQASATEDAVEALQAEVAKQEEYFFIHVTQTGTNNPVVTEVGGSVLASSVSFTCTRNEVGRYTFASTGFVADSVQVEFVKFGTTTAADPTLTDELQVNMLSNLSFQLVQIDNPTELSSIVGLEGLTFKVSGYEITT